jgi:UPF0176 protein
MHCNYSIVSLYQFKFFPCYDDYRTRIKDICILRNINGTIIISLEGINGTISGSSNDISYVVKYVQEVLLFDNLECKYFSSDICPFSYLRIRSKREIVTLGKFRSKYSLESGVYVNPEDWNNLITDSSVVVLDTRNDYEVKIGSFKGAINPRINNFREIPDFIMSRLNTVEHKRVAMFCTGGIRCEKSTSYMISKGFNSVYHLKGGILSYIKKIPSDVSLWQGDCFVFDNRVSISGKLESKRYSLCYGCRSPILYKYEESLFYKHGSTCYLCYFITKKHNRRDCNHKFNTFKFIK